MFAALAYRKCITLVNKIVGRGRWIRSVRASADDTLRGDIEWLHATIGWLILHEDDRVESLEDYISRPTLARKAHDKLDRLSEALGFDNGPRPPSLMTSLHGCICEHRERGWWHRLLIWMSR